MKKEPYQIRKKNVTQYEFISEGKKSITKVVQFEQLEIDGYYNLAFGDRKTDGTVDDIVESNNNDLLKVMTTVIRIVQDFLEDKPDIKLFFQGSTSQRTKFYRTILKRNYSEFSRQFILTGLVKENSKIIEKPFYPESEEQFIAFIIEKI